MLVAFKRNFTVNKIGRKWLYVTVIYEERGDLFPYEARLLKSDFPETVTIGQTVCRYECNSSIVRKNGYVTLAAVSAEERAAHADIQCVVDKIKEIGLDANFRVWKFEGDIRFLIEVEAAFAEILALNAIPKLPACVCHYIAPTTNHAGNSYCIANYGSVKAPRKGEVAIKRLFDWAKKIVAENVRIIANVTAISYK
jgi:hypothetical protein